VEGKLAAEMGDEGGHHHLPAARWAATSWARHSAQPVRASGGVVSNAPRRASTSPARSSEGRAATGSVLTGGTVSERCFGLTRIVLAELLPGRDGPPDRIGAPSA
jgi:hypothetical protein